MNVGFVLCVALTSASCATTNSVEKRVLREAQGYAIACCLAKQSEPYLQQQGDGWASIIIERGNLDLNRLKVIDEHVRKVLAKGRAPVVHNETMLSGDATLPIFYCVEVVDEPEVRSAIEQSLPSR